MEPRGEAYRQLLDFCHARCARVSLVVREMQWLSDAGVEILERLRPHQISVNELSEWPGTKLLADTASVYQYQASPRLLPSLRSAASGLYDWVHPERPEDLCFIRKDGTPMLVSISHERDAYLELTSDEVLQLRGKADLIVPLIRPRPSG